MSAAVIGALRVTLGLNSAQFTTGLTAAQQQLSTTSSKMEAIGKKMAGIGTAMTLGITTPIIAAGVHLLQGSQDAAAASAQVQAALTSMGSASGKTLEQLQATAEGLRNLTGVDDDEILKSVTANLLTFGAIQGDVFDRAQQSIVDISARLGSDLQSATMMVGKALNDPIKGLGALRKTGIQFTEQQEKQITTMTKAGDVAGAQAIMLAELERQFGGAAKAAADADIWTPMKTAMMDLEGAFEPLIRSVVTPAITGIANLTRAFAALPESMIPVIAAGAAIAAAIGPILVGAGAVVASIGAIGSAIAAGGLAASIAGFAVAAAPFVAAAAAIGVAVYMFRDDLGPILSDFGKQVYEAIGPSIPPLIEAARTAVTAFVDTVSALFAVLGPILASLGKDLIVAFGPILVTTLRLMGATMTSVFDIVGQALRVVSALLKGDWSGAWNAAGSLVQSVIRSLGRIVEAIFPGIIGHARRMVEGVRDWFGARLNDIFGGVIRRVTEVGDAFFKLYDRVVGHSYVPDMVEETGEWMAKLQGALVDPAVKGTKTAAEAFEDMRDRARAAMSGLLTETERLDLDYLAQKKDLAGIADPRQRAEFERRAAEQYRAKRLGLEIGELQMPKVPQLVGLDPDGKVKNLNETIDRMNQSIHDSRERFADAFSYGIDSALRGDWRGLLESFVGSAFDSALRNMGRSMFDNLGGGKGGGFSLGGVGSAISSFFGKIPGFATGGSFRVGGSGGVDSKLVSMRLTPGEMVDIRRPGAVDGPGSARHMQVEVVPSKYFDVRVRSAAQPMVAESGAQAVNVSRKVVPAEQGRKQRYSF